MRGFDQAVQDRIEAAIGRLEDDCTLEVVVRVAPRSGSYRDVRWGVGAVLGLEMLALILFGPFVVPPALVLPNVVLIGLVGAWVGGWPAIVPFLTRRKRRRWQVQQAARAVFVEQAVADTADRTGVLVYCSALEDRIHVIADDGARGVAPDAEWAQVTAFADPDGRPLADRLFATLDALDALGSAHLPCAPGDANPDELSNRPIVG